MTFKSLSFGDDSDYLITGIDGWEDRPETTNGSTPHPRRLGSWVGGLSSTKRVVTVNLEILADRENGNQTTIPKNKLSKALALDDDESPLMLDLGYGLEREIIYARVTAFDMPTVRGYGRKQTALIEFTATDPRRYSIGTSYATAGMPVNVRGVLYPITYGRYPEVITPGEREAVVQNIGNTLTPPTYKIAGPVRNPIITVNGPKNFRRRIQFNINLAAGETLIATPAYGSITVNKMELRGITSGALMEDMEIPAGTSSVRLGGSGDGTAKLTVSWRDANL